MNIFYRLLLAVVVLGFSSNVSAQWNLIPKPLEADGMYYPIFFSKTEGLIYARTALDSVFLFRTGDGGFSWAQEQLRPTHVWHLADTVSGYGSYGDMRFHDNQAGYLVEHLHGWDSQGVGLEWNSILYRTFDAGKTWEQWDLPDEIQNVLDSGASITLPNANTIVLTGRDVPNASSSDRGATWKITHSFRASDPSQPVYLNANTAVQTNVGWFWDTRPQDGFWRDFTQFTTDGGMKWIELSYPEHVVYDASMYPRYVWIDDEHTLQYKLKHIFLSTSLSTWGSTSDDWQLAYADDDLYEIGEPVRFQRNWLAPADYYDSSGILYSIDNGASWQKFTLFDLPHRGASLFVSLDSSTLFAIYRDSIYRLEVPLHAAPTVSRIVGLQIYPNPVRSTLHLHGELPSVSEVTVTDGLGRVVFVTNAPLSSATDRVSLDVGALPPGLYSISASQGRATFIKE